MAKVKGYQVTVSGVSAGSEQSSSLSVQNNIQEVEVKDSTNPLSPPQEVTSAQWNIQQTVKLDNAAGVKALIQAAVGTSAVAVSMDADGATFSGQSLIGDLSIQAPNRGDITAQVQYQGTGALTKATT
jgi:hypothetical protein